MSRVFRLPFIFSLLLLLPASAWAQIDFDKTGYYLALGDSVAAGEGALPVTNGYVYQLYDHGVFGAKLGPQGSPGGAGALRGATADGGNDYGWCQRFPAG